MLARPDCADGAAISRITAISVKPRVIGVIVVAKLVLRECVIRIAIQPSFAGLGRGDHGVSAAAGVSRGVAMGRVVTTMGASALLAGAQVHPLAAGLDALVTLVAARRLEGGDGFDV